MQKAIGRGNIPALQTINGAHKQATIEAICDWVAEDGTCFSITLTPNCPHHPFSKTLTKLRRLSAALAYGPRGVPRSCEYRNIKRDKPRLVGFEEGQVDTKSDARIRHFHGLIGLRSEAEEHFCRDFLDRYWCDLHNPLGPNNRTYDLTNTAAHTGAARGWLRYATKRDAFTTTKEPIFIG